MLITTMPRSSKYDDLLVKNSQSFLSPKIELFINKLKKNYIKIFIIYTVWGKNVILLHWSQSKLLKYYLVNIVFYIKCFFYLFFFNLFLLTTVNVRCIYLKIILFFHNRFICTVISMINIVQNREQLYSYLSNPKNTLLKFFLFFCWTL